MTGTVVGAAIAMIVFVATHIVPSLPAIRGPLVGVLGEWGFRIAYSIVSLITLFWAIIAFNDAPYVEVWFPAVALQHLTLTVMPVAIFFVVCGLTTPNPTITGLDTRSIADRGPIGVLKITRHPMMWAVTLWAVVHLLASGDAASLWFYGGLAVLALVGAAMIDLKKRQGVGETWVAYERQTSFLPFAAIVAGRTRLRFSEIGWLRILGSITVYVALLVVHPYLFGVNPWPL